MTEEFKKYNELSKDDLSDHFIEACHLGNFNKIKHLLTSPELKNHADIHHKNDDGFKWACAKGYLDIAKYLLTSPDLKEHADMHSAKPNGDDAVIQLVCHNGHLEILKYLLTSPELKTHLDLHAYKDSGFIIATQNKHLNIVEYMIFDLDIEKTANITKYLSSRPNLEVEKMFEIRELNKQLNNELNCNKLPQKKNKL